MMKAIAHNRGVNNKDSQLRRESESASNHLAWLYWTRLQQHACLL